MADANAAVARARPASNPDGVIGQANHRLGPYGDANVQILGATKHALAEEGSYYVCTNPTIGSAVTFAVSSSFSDTAPFFHVANTGPSNGPYIFLDYMRFIMTTAPTTSTQWRFVVKVDTALRLPTAGNATLTANNLNMAQANALTGIVSAGTSALLTIPASSGNARTVANGSLRSAVPVAFDEIFLTFGQAVSGDGAPTTATRTTGFAAPVVIPGGCSAAIYMWGPSNNAAVTGEYELAMWQR